MTLRRIDAAIAAALFLAAAGWGAWQYNRFVGRGGRPFFYQSYFEPAVMTACGRGFVVSQVQPPALHAFLYQQSDRFSCDALPRHLAVGTQGLYQGPWRYLLTLVAAAWTVLGISWSGLGPLFGILFGTTTAAVYGLCRLLAGRTMSALAAVAMCVSPLQTANLPNLRDYAKAPFIVALILLLTALVVRPWRRRDILATSLAYGALLGIGYGFRTDLLILIPAFLVAIAFFLPGGVAGHVGVKVGAVGCLLAGFAFAAWPIVSAVASGGGCQWHFVLLGLARPFDAALGVHGGDYAWGHLYKDESVWAAVSSYAHMTRPDAGYVEYCSPAYDVASWAYLRQIITIFPADFVTRAYAAAWRMLNFGFHRVVVPAFVGPLAAAVVIVATAARSVRIAAFAAFAILYFGGQLAIQFLPRHYFPFEFIALAVLAICVDRGVRLAMGRDRAPWEWRQAATCAAIAVALLIAPLVALRAYQEREAARLLQRYDGAPTRPIPFRPVAPGTFRLSDTRPSSTMVAAVSAIGDAVPRFASVDIDARSCRPGTTLTFQYDHTYGVTDLSYTVPLESAGAASGVTRIFEPLYPGFEGIDVSDQSAGCVPRLSAVDVQGLPLLLSAQLTPGWTAHSQFQRIAFSR